MSTLLIAIALLLSATGDHDHALIVAIAALVFAVRSAGRRGWLNRWLGWDEAIDDAVTQREIDRDRAR